MDPITAVTQADPYPYYASLRARGGLTFDPGLGMWLASSAAAVAAVLAHPECRVRPAHEPVPQAIVDGAAGKVFGQLMRMNDGERQRCPRAAIEPGLQLVPAEEIQQRVAALLLGLPRIPLPGCMTASSACRWRWSPGCWALPRTSCQRLPG